MERPKNIFFIFIRVVIGLLLIFWGVVSFAIPIVPGGVWTILIGLAVLSIDTPALKDYERRLKMKIERCFPRFYNRIILPFDRVKEKILNKLRFGEKGGDDAC